MATVKPQLGGKGTTTDVTTESVTNPVLALPPPTGGNTPVEGDLLLALIYKRSSTFPITAQGSGWTYYQAISTTGDVQLWWRYATSSEPSTHDFLMTGTANFSSAGLQGYIQRITGANQDGNPIGFWGENSGQNGESGWTVNGGTTPEELWIRGIIYGFSDIDQFGYPAGADFSSDNPEAQGGWAVDWDRIVDHYTTTVPSWQVVAGDVSMGNNDYWANGHFTIRPQPDDENAIMMGANF